MYLYQVRQYTKFPFKIPSVDKLIESFETLHDAEEFSISHNCRKDKKYGNYLPMSDEGYYVMEINAPWTRAKTNLNKK